RARRRMAAGDITASWFETPCGVMTMRDNHSDIERAELVLLVGSRRKHRHQREGGFRIFLPDRKVLGGDDHEAEPEHVAAGFGDLVDLRPVDLHHVRYPLDKRP